MYPLVESMPYKSPQSWFEALPQGNAIWLDSAQAHPTRGRYSYIALDPFQKLVLKGGRMNGQPCSDPFEVLKSLLQKYQLEKVPYMPPFQGGMAGFFSYDLGWYLEDLPNVAQADIPYEDWILGLYDLVLAFDHAERKAWGFSSGFPYLEPDKRLSHARRRLDRLKGMCPNHSEIDKRPAKRFVKPQSIASNFTQSDYEGMVQTTRDYIAAGDIFEANLTQRFKVSFDRTNSLDLYTCLRENNGAPFSAYINFDETILASASPERFLKLESGCVEARPIKGTAKRSDDPALDKQVAQALIESEKDRAENVMIVDLMRNDLSRVCKPYSIQVPQLCGLESFATVHHLVSCVEGVLNAGHDAIDLLKATFPAGSITGAPKIRAMEIIDELERHKRGPYCGSIGYLGFSGDMDLSVTIRTYAIKDDTITYAAGGAVVTDSNPKEEYLESLAKAQALTDVLTGMAPDGRCRQI